MIVFSVCLQVVVLPSVVQAATDSVTFALPKLVTTSYGGSPTLDTRSKVAHMALRMRAYAGSLN